MSNSVTENIFVKGLGCYSPTPNSFQTLAQVLIPLRSVYIYQNVYLFWFLSMRENVLAGCKPTKHFLKPRLKLVCNALHMNGVKGQWGKVCAAQLRKRQFRGLNSFPKEQFLHSKVISNFLQEFSIEHLILFICIITLSFFILILSPSNRR